MWVGTVGDRVVLALALAKNETVMLTNMEPLRVLGTDRSLLAFVVCLIALDSQKQRTLLTAGVLASVNRANSAFTQVY